MVQAIMEGRKTMTRRIRNLQVVNQNPDKVEFMGVQDYTDGKLRAIFLSDDSDDPGSVISPYGKKGNILWVRETWKKNDRPIGFPYFHYADDDVFTNKDYEKWKPSIHMPKAAARLFLKITGVRVERLHDISGADAVSEGIDVGTGLGCYHYIRKTYSCHDTIESFESLWMKINGLESWELNPWVWCVSFIKINLTDDEKMSFLSGLQR